MTTAIGRIGRLGLIASAAIAATAPPGDAAEGASLRLSTGHVIVMSPAAAMDCPALAGKLDEIDRTGYRGRRPEPANASDLPMLRYENEISNRYYSRCTRVEKRGEKRRDALFPAAPAAPKSNVSDTGGQ